MSFIRARFAVLFTLALIALAPSIALARMRLAKEGVVLYWGLVPAAVVSQKHALEDMHGGLPGRPGEIEFAASAWSPHRENR